MWCINRGKKDAISIAIDMTQNMMTHGQTVEECMRFEEEVFKRTGEIPYFIEEPLCPYPQHLLPELRDNIHTKLAGGEIITTPLEMKKLLLQHCYDIVQPDVSVIGGATELKRYLKMPKETISIQ